MQQEDIRSFVVQCINQYCAEHGYEIRYDSSDHSEYFFIVFDKDKAAKVRVSNHDAKEYCCILNIRYDRIGKNAKKQAIKENIYRRLDSGIKREKRYALRKLLATIQVDS